MEYAVVDAGYAVCNIQTDIKSLHSTTPPFTRLCMTACGVGLRVVVILPVDWLP